MPPQPSDNPYKQPGAVFSESRGFTGVDLFTDPQDLTGNYLLQADNFLNVAGMLVSRPGMKGLFGGAESSSSSSGSLIPYFDVGDTYWDIPAGTLYDLCDFADEFGYMWLIVTAGGKVYKTQQASNCYTELLDVDGSSYALDSPNAVAVKAGNFMLLADGSMTALRRLNLDGGFPAYPMIAPADSPATALTNGLLVPLSETANPANWSFDGEAAPGFTNILPAASKNWPVGGLVPIGGSDLRGTGWTITGEQGPAQGGWPENVNLIAAAVNIAMSNQGAGVAPGQAGGYLAVPPLSGSTAETPVLYPDRFHFQMLADKNDFGTKPNTYSGLVQITPYDVNLNQLGSAATVVINPPGNTWVMIDEIIDFSGMGPNVAYVTLQITNTNSSSQGNLYVGAPVLVPISVQTSFTPSNIAGAVKVVPHVTGGALTQPTSSSSSSSSSSMSAVYAVANAPTDLGNTLDYQGTSLTFTFPVAAGDSSCSSSGGGPVGGIDLSLINRLVIAVNGIAAWQGAAFSLSLQQVGLNADEGGAWILADNGVTISEDLTGLDCDISTLPAADLTNIVAIKLTFLTDPVWLSPFYALQLGPIYEPGNLTIGDAPYTYYITEEAVIDPLNSIEGNPSLPSSDVIPSFSQAETIISLPADCPKNTQAPIDVPIDQLWYNLYRLGGVWPDVRQIASVSSQVSVGCNGAPADPQNPYYTWNNLTGQFVDNTPDLYLTLANLMSFSKDPMPSGISCLATWQGRTCAMVANQIYIGWLYNADDAANIQTTLVLNEDDPNLPIDGAFFPCSPDVSDIGVALRSFGTPVQAGEQFGGGLLVYNKRSVGMVQGNDASDFSYKTYDYGEGVGLIARRGEARISADQAIFMGPDRLHYFPPHLDNPLKDPGLIIQPQLYPVPPTTPLQNSTAMAEAWMIFHDSRLYLGCPVPGGTGNSVIWILDTRVNGWTRWTNMAIAGAMSEPPNANGASYDLYLLGINGQMYLMTGTVDLDTPLSAPTAICLSCTVHAMRPGFFYRYKLHPLFYGWARLEWMEVEFQMTGLLTMTAQAWTAGTDAPMPIPGAKSVQTYQLAGGGRPFRKNLPSGLIEGMFVTLALTASVTDVATLRGVRGFISMTGTEAG